MELTEKQTNNNNKEKRGGNFELFIHTSSLKGISKGDTVFFFFVLCQLRVMVKSSDITQTMRWRWNNDLRVRCLISFSCNFDFLIICRILSLFPSDILAAGYF